MEIEIRYSYGKIITEMQFDDLPADLLLSLLVQILNKAEVELTRDQGDLVENWYQALRREQGAV